MLNPSLSLWVSGWLDLGQGKCWLDAESWMEGWLGVWAWDRLGAYAKCVCR